MHVHMCVCVCMCVRLSLVYQPTFQVDESLSGKLDPVTAFGWGPSTVDSSELEEAPPSTAAAGPHVCLSGLPPAQALLTLITPSQRNSQVASLGGGGTSPPDPQLLISSVD